MAAKGIIQSFHRFLPEFNFLTLDKEEDRYSKLLAKVLKIATHEVGHVFGQTHCKFFNCVMKGEYGVWETDESPIYLCPECYWKMFNFLKFDHTKRFEDLNNLCEKFGGEFLQENKDGKSYSGYFKKRLNDVRKIKSAQTVSRSKSNKNFIIKTVQENNQFISRSSSTSGFVTCSRYPKSEATIGLGLISTLSHKRKMKRLSVRKSVKDMISNCIYN